MEVISLTTTQREEMLSVTHAVEQLLRKKQWLDGAVLLYCPHTTAAITINESADPDVRFDITRFMHQIVPQHFGFNHAEGNSDAHIKASLFNASCMLIIEKGEILKGAWQDVYFCEWDGPRSRKLWVQFLHSSS